MAHILLIEPDRVLAKQYHQALRAAGYEVTACLSGQGGIEAADGKAPDVVVLELQLKGHNGVEFLYEFRSYPEWQRVPVIAHTLVPAQSLEAISTVPLLGITQYLYKPATNLAKLCAAVDDVLRQSVSA